MKKGVLFIFLLLLSFQFAFSQVVIKGKAVSLRNHSEKVQSLLRHYQIFDIDIPKLYRAVKNERNGMEVQLVLNDTHLNLTVFPNLIRANDYKHAKNGKVCPVDSTVEKCITYKGFVNGNKKATLRLTITNTMFEGYITHNSEILYITQLNDLGFRKAGIGDNIIVYRKEDVKIKGGYCGVTTSQETRYLASLIQKKVTDAPLLGNCRTVEIATDADYEWYQRFGNNANNEILSILNSVEGVYQNDFNLNIVVTYQNVWTSSNDPFTGNPLTGSGAEALLNEFRNYWENNMQSVDRDLAHLFVGKHYDYSGTDPVVVGIAYEGVVCTQPDHSYGFTKRRLSCFLTTAHEIGHNFGGLHSDGQDCHTYNASIMCQGIKKIPMYFSNASITRISNFMNAQPGCLSPLTHSISGPNMICNSGTYTLIGDIPVGSSVTWSASPSGLISLSSNGNQVTASKIGNGIVTLIANISGCTNFTASKTIEVGTPPKFDDISCVLNCYNSPPGSNTFCTNTDYHFFAAPGGDGTYWASQNITYIWSYTNVVTHVFTPVGTYHGSFVDIEPKINFPQAGTYNIQVVAENQCGMSSVAKYQVSVSGCYGRRFTLSPNPASSTITITTAVTDKHYAKVKKYTNHVAIQSVKIYTSSGRLVKKQKFSRNSSQVQIDISALIPGIYFVEVNDGTNKAVQKLVVGNKSKAIWK